MRRKPKRKTRRRCVRQRLHQNGNVETRRVVLYGVITCLTNVIQALAWIIYRMLTH